MKENKTKRSLLGEVLEGSFIAIVLTVLAYFIFGQILLPGEKDSSYQRCEIFDTQWEHGGNQSCHG